MPFEEPAQSALFEKIGEIKGMLVGIQTSQIQYAVNHFELEKRVRVLEQWRAYAIGIAVAISMGAQVVVQYIFSHNS